VSAYSSVVQGVALRPLRLEPAAPAPARASISPIAFRAALAAVGELVPHHCATCGQELWPSDGTVAAFDPRLQRRWCEACAVRADLARDVPGELEAAKVEQMQGQPKVLEVAEARPSRRRQRRRQWWVG
jgi:hypothetical protein